MNKTQIEWVKNPDGSQGYTWNPITGCLNHINGMCKGGGFPCYAYRLANGRLKQRYLANENVAYNEEMTYPRHLECMSDPFYPRFWEERLNDIKRPPYPFSAWDGNACKTTPIEFLPINRHAKRKAKGIFTCDMSDLFGIGVPEEWTTRILEEIRVNSVDRFYLLTKQPQNLIKFSPFPDNCWVGVTITGKDKGYYLDKLQQIEATVKFISFEPLLAPITYLNELWRVNWVIIGAQTKPYKPPKIEWVEEIVKAADEAGIPVFLKDSLKPLLQQNQHNIYSFPEWAGKQFAVTGDLSLSPHSSEAMRRLRQELPKC